MIELPIDEVISEALIRLRIGKFQGPNFAPYRSGAVVKVRPGSTMEAFSRHPPGTLMNMGAFSYAAENEPGLINLSLGRYCSVAIGLRILDGVHPLGAVTTNTYIYGPFYTAGNIPADYVYRGKREPFATSYGPIRAGHDVWIGAHCMIRAGVTIGHGAVIAGGSNVTRDVPPYAIVGGNPAEVIRYRFPEELRERLLAIEWWNISPTILRDLNMHDPDAFCTRLERMAANGNLVPFIPARLRVDEKGELWLTEADEE